MKAPKFWKKKGTLSSLMLPASFLYGFAAALRHFFATPEKIDKPIICVGNLVVGGAGKTPIAIEIGSILKEIGVEFAFLSRGYKGKIDNFTLVNRDFHNAVEVGDEPLLLSEISNSFIAKNRLFGASQIAKMPDKDLILMDDGLQHPYFSKDYSILVIDGSYGFGNERLMPSGPLREKKEKGIKKADLVVIIGEDEFKVADSCKDKKVVSAQIKVTNAQEFTQKKVVAFCGIGRPDKFLVTLHKVGCDLISFFSYPDHYTYKDKEIKKMISLAKKHDALVVTTKKDWVRLSQEQKKKIKHLDIKVEFDDKDYIRKELKELLNNAK